jgi:hypothetical protein
MRQFVGYDEAARLNAVQCEVDAFGLAEEGACQGPTAALAQGDNSALPLRPVP